MIKKFILYDKSNDSSPLGVLVEFENTGKVVLEHKNSLIVFDSIDCLLLSNENYLLREF